MKRFLLFFSFLIIVITVAIERGGLAWELERPLVQFLAKKTHRSLPGVTAVVLPIIGNVLVPQDVALTVRAMLSFKPHLILVAAPLGDLSSGPLSLIREAQTEGTLQETSFVFSSLPNQQAHERYQSANVFFLPSPPLLTSVVGGIGSPSLFGFILPQDEKKESLSMPLFGKTPDGTIIGSLWWRGLHNVNVGNKEEKSSAPAFLLGGRMVFFPNNNVIWLGADASLMQKKVPQAKMVSLDDFLLRREEMERGQIRPDLDGLFRDKTVIIGGKEAVQEAGILQDAQQQLALRHLNTALYGALLFALSLGMVLITRFSGIDFLLLLFFSLCIYAGGIFLLFRFFGILLPLLLPASLMLAAFLKKRT